MTGGEREGFVYLCYMNRLAVDNTLFWDWDLDTLDFRKAYVSVIGRILERGTEQEWQEMIRFYGKDKVKETIKNEIPYLPAFIIPKVTRYFSITKKEIKCCIKKRSRRSYWI